MIFLGLLLFIILLIIFTGGKDGGGGGGGSGLPKFEFLYVITSMSECTAPFDTNSTETVDVYACIYRSQDSQTLCASDINYYCSVSDVYSLSTQFNTFLQNDGEDYVNIDSGIVQSITAFNDIAQTYSELGSYELVNTFNNVGMRSRLFRS